MTEKPQTVLFPTYRIARDWLFCPSTYLVDSFEPFVEEIYLPSVATKAGELLLSYEEQGETLFQPSSFVAKIKSRYRKNKSVLVDSVALDLRQHYPGNIAHAIMIHLPLALWAREYLLKIGQSNPILIFPASLPKYIGDMFIEIGFEIVLTNDKVSGKLCNYNLDLLIGIRGEIPSIIKSGLEDSEFSKKLLQRSIDLPKKLFISRRDTRRLSNETEVEKFLKIRGFQKIYMEDYSILDQLALVSLADSIVAIHGAALGSLILRSMFNKKPLEFVEIFSPAHMTNVYRIITHQVGGKWVGVRGRLWPKLVMQAYECEMEKVRQYTFVDFEVCLLSLEKAMESICTEHCN